MTIRQLKALTKCAIFIDRTDEDGAWRRTEYTGGIENPQICNIRIIRDKVRGFALAVEIEEGGE